VRGVSLRWLAFKFTRRQNQWTASVKKELQLQEITMFLIPSLALLHLIVLTLHHFAPQRISKDLIFAFPLIWMVAMPLVIGCVAVAEERRYNTLESLLCLPMTKHGQFLVKLAVVMVLGIVLGGILPWVLLHFGGNRIGDFKLKNAVEIAAGVTAISFYASTMSRGLLQALPTAVCIPALMGMIIALIIKFIEPLNMPLAHDMAQSPLFPALAWPAAIITFLWLSFNNYKQLQIGWRLWLGNLIRAAAVAGCVMLAAFTIFNLMTGLR
jgi:ABC-type Na+ efflux pump permease subunit